MKARAGTWLSIALVALAISWVSPASAQQPDIAAAEKRFDALVAAHDYAGALVEGQKLEAVIKARVGTSHREYAIVLYRLAAVYQSQGKMPRRRNSTSARLRSSRKLSAPTIRMWPRSSTTSPWCAHHKANMPRRRASTGARSPSARKRSAPAIRMWPRASTTSLMCTNYKANMPGGGTLPARSRHPRESARPRPPGYGHKPR